jgi:hypothetical protein
MQEESPACTRSTCLLYIDKLWPKTRGGSLRRLHPGRYSEILTGTEVPKVVIRHQHKIVVPVKVQRRVELPNLPVGPRLCRVITVTGTGRGVAPARAFARAIGECRRPGGDGGDGRVVDRVAGAFIEFVVGEGLAAVIVPGNLGLGPGVVVDLNIIKRAFEERCPGCCPVSSNTQRVGRRAGAAARGGVPAAFDAVYLRARSRVVYFAPLLLTNVPLRYVGTVMTELEDAKGRIRQALDALARFTDEDIPGITERLPQSERERISNFAESVREPAFLGGVLDPEPDIIRFFSYNLDVALAQAVVDISNSLEKMIEDKQFPPQTS